MIVVVFSVSTVVKGKQMVSVLNAMNITCACYGNHDFGKFLFLFVPLGGTRVRSFVKWENFPACHTKASHGTKCPEIV